MGIPSSNSDVDSGGFAEQMASLQGRLESFIRSVIGDPDAARDILQDTNVVLLRKAREYRLGTNFSAWAFRVARFEIMTWRRKAGRSRLVFDDALVERLAETASRNDELHGRRMEALRDCLGKLPERQREAIRRRYLKGFTVAEMAAASGESPNAVSQLLFRARQNLLACLECGQAESPVPGHRPNPS